MERSLPSTTDINNVRHGNVIINIVTKQEMLQGISRHF